MSEADDDHGIVRGQRIRVLSGPLKGCRGVVRDIDTDNGRLTADLLIFGRTTTAEFENGEVESVD